MGWSWMDELWQSDPSFDEDPTESFYCPYTNRDECALLTKGWQPQELCAALECEQLKYLRRRRRSQAA